MNEETQESAPFNRDPLGSVFRSRDQAQFKSAPQRVAVKHRGEATKKTNPTRQRGGALPDASDSQPLGASPPSLTRRVSWSRLRREAETSSYDSLQITAKLSGSQSD